MNSLDTTSNAYGEKPKLLIFIVAYNAGEKIISVLSRIPTELVEKYEVNVLIIDDCSTDDTFDIGNRTILSTKFPFEINILQNPVNQGYGGNQKLGYHYAEENGFDYVALLHGDGQYAPEALPNLVDKLATDDQIAAVFGSRMMEPGKARQGGMPLYKYVGNKILTWYQNKMLGSNLSEFHSGYRIYRVSDLKLIKYELNTNDFHFDTEIIIQFFKKNKSIKEVPIPTYYGDEICHVNGIKYAWDIFKTTLKSKLQEYNVLYDRKFETDEMENNSEHYVGKSDFPSPHQFSVEHITQNNSEVLKVLDIGCASGYVSRDLIKKGAIVTGVDKYSPASKELSNFESFIKYDLNKSNEFPVSISNYDYVLLLDVIEHLQEPELFMRKLRATMDGTRNIPKIIVSTGNIGFIVIRLMLLFGQFNYGKKGILDITHTRLFTFRSMKWLFQQNGFKINKVYGIPVPFPLAFQNRFISKNLLCLNQFLIKISKTLFSYQMIYIVEPIPTLDALVKHSEKHSAERKENI